MSPVEIKTVKYQFKIAAATSSALGPTLQTERLTQADMRRLAASSARLLIAHVRSGQMRPAQLSFAAELLGDVAERRPAELALLNLLDHESSVVREGAVYGLAKFDSPTARAALGRVAANDPSPGIREAATEALDG